MLNCQSLLRKYFDSFPTSFGIDLDVMTWDVFIFQNFFPLKYWNLKISLWDSPFIMSSVISSSSMPLNGSITEYLVYLGYIIISYPVHHWILSLKINSDNYWLPIMWDVSFRYKMHCCSFYLVVILLLFNASVVINKLIHPWSRLGWWP